MEEDSRGGISEDEHPSTDASEDSVEVRITPISSPHHKYFPEHLSRLPRKFRKAFEKSYNRQNSHSPTDLEREKEASKNNCEDPPPIEFSGDLSSNCTVTTGRKTPPRPHSPLSRVRGSRRKLTAPRRVVEQERSKRPVEEEWQPRKNSRTQENQVPILPPNLPPHHPILGENPFLRHIVPQPLILPPAWGPISRHPYTHLVGLAPQLGLLSGTPYPLLPILHSHLGAAQTVQSEKRLNNADREKSDNSLRNNISNKLNGLAETPFPLSGLDLPHSFEVHKEQTPLSSAILPSTSGSSNSLSRKHQTKHSSKNFLSVETILLNKSIKKEEIIKEEPLYSKEHKDNPEETIFNNHDEEATFQNLLHAKQKQRNYKNMTRERRIEANARERTRVHTISAAFETLRQAVPSFSHNQKLSKLSVLRIASAYILSLSRLAGYDYSVGQTSPSFEECVDLTTKTIQTEGKAKKKRDD